MGALALLKASDHDPFFGRTAVWAGKGDSLWKTSITT